MHRPWADASCTSSPWQAWKPHQAWDTSRDTGKKPSPWTPPRWGHCIYFHKALQAMLDLKPGSNVFVSDGGVLFCFVPVMYFCRDIGVSPTPLFYNCLTTLVSLEVIDAGPWEDGWRLPVPIVSGAGWFATKLCNCWRDGCDYCGSACPKSCVDFMSLIYRSV